MIYLGIDPGASGAIACVFSGHGEADVCKLDNTERDIWDFLQPHVKAERYAFIEKVASSSQMGVKSAFSFGRSYGFLRGLLVAMEIPFEEVSPQKWQKEMGCMSGGDKNVTKAKAQQLFPTMKVTHANADALLISEYCRRTRSPHIASFVGGNVLHVS